MLESLAAQLQTLQEVVVLDTDRPLSELLGRVIEQAGQLLGSDACCVYRLRPEQAGAARWPRPRGGSRVGRSISLARAPSEPIVKALGGARTPVAVSGRRRWRRSARRASARAQ